MAGLAEAAAALVAPGKGILAADGSGSTMAWRLAAAGVAATAASRQAYREMLVTAPGLGRGISGVILAAETLRQRLRDGRRFPAALADLGIMTGVKADAGAGPLPGTQGEPVTEGLDGILARLRGYAGLGARFATWRAVLRIGPGMPSALAIRANAQALARYAAACQEAGLVPIVEPAVLMNGSPSLGRCATVTSLILLEVLSNLDEYGVDFAGRGAAAQHGAARRRPGRFGAAGRGGVGHPAARWTACPPRWPGWRSCPAGSGRNGPPRTWPRCRARCACGRSRSRSAAR